MFSAKILSFIIINNTFEYQNNDQIQSSNNSSISLSPYRIFCLLKISHCFKINFKPSFLGYICIYKLFSMLGTKIESH